MSFRYQAFNAEEEALQKIAKMMCIQNQLEITNKLHYAGEMTDVEYIRALKQLDKLNQ